MTTEIQQFIQDLLSALGGENKNSE